MQAQLLRRLRERRDALVSGLRRGVSARAGERGPGADRALGDGADGIWRFAPRFLDIGQAEIVDIYHVWEHRGTVAAAVFGHGTNAAMAWLEPLKVDLLTVGVAPVLAALADLTPADPHAADEVRKALGYFTTHAARMDYPRFIAHCLTIGSGTVESAFKTLIEEREKGAGMRWMTFWQSHPPRRRPWVFPRPPRPIKEARLKQPSLTSVGRTRRPHWRMARRAAAWPRLAGRRRGVWPGVRQPPSGTPSWA